jgi:hypothetical protein
MLFKLEDHVLTIELNEEQNRYIFDLFLDYVDDLLVHENQLKRYALQHLIDTTPAIYLELE